MIKVNDQLDAVKKWNEMGISTKTHRIIKEISKELVKFNKIRGITPNSAIKEILNGMPK